MSCEVDYTEYDRWRDDNGEDLRHSFNLNENSIVVDVGGYEGDWAARIFAKYRCWMYVLEPVPCFATNIVARFKYHNKIVTCIMGLSDKMRKETIRLNGDSSGLNCTTGTECEVFLDSLEGFKNTYLLSSPIDLIKINIEGEEYRLLNNIITSGAHKEIKGILVQFHRNIHDYENKYAEIAEELSKTHNLKFQYKFIWEYWELKK